jgi:hypothetical protein
LPETLATAASSCPLKFDDRVVDDLWSQQFTLEFAEQQIFQVFPANVEIVFPSRHG